MALDIVEVTAPSPEKNPRRVSLDLRQYDLDELGEVKPGDTVHVMLVGEVTGISMHEPYSENGDDYVGYLDIDAKRVQVENRSTFEELSEDD